MCTRRTAKVLERIVRDRCLRGEMFTAFDVSREAHRHGCPERHRQMKHVVHGAFSGGLMGPEYRRVLVDIPGAAEPAWLYHHEADDPAFHEAVDHRGPLPQTASWHGTLPVVRPSFSPRPAARRRSRRTVFSLFTFFSRCPDCAGE